MVVWRNYLVLFGGFYEAMREVRWYNDAYVYSFQEKRWTLIPQRANAQVTMTYLFRWMDGWMDGWMSGWITLKERPSYSAFSALLLLLL
jgi:hypothetical protein